MITFAVLVAAAVTLRRRADAHKRLMLLATISILTAAVARFLAQVNIGGTVGLFLGTDLFVLAVILYDFASRGAISPRLALGRRPGCRIQTAAVRCLRHLGLALVCGRIALTVIA